MLTSLSMQIERSLSIHAATCGLRVRAMLRHAVCARAPRGLGRACPAAASQPRTPRPAYGPNGGVSGADSTPRTSVPTSAASVPDDCSWLLRVTRAVTDMVCEVGEEVGEEVEEVSVPDASRHPASAARCVTAAGEGSQRDAGRIQSIARAVARTSGALHAVSSRVDQVADRVSSTLLRWHTGVSEAATGKTRDAAGLGALK